MLALTTCCTICALAPLLPLAVDAGSSSSSVYVGSEHLGGSRSRVPAADGGAGGSKPHLVFLFCDNVGWANVGFHRAAPTPEVVTPNIDELVRWLVECFTFDCRLAWLMPFSIRLSSVYACGCSGTVYTAGSIWLGARSPCTRHSISVQRWLRDDLQLHAKP